MARLQNPWVGYVDRSFEQIKASLLSRLGVNNPEITDHSESNILIIIISMFAGLVEMLGLYIDNMARESYIGTARKFVSMVRLVRILDYRIKAKIASAADVTFASLDGSGDPFPITAPTIIPQNTKVGTESGIEFLTVEDLVLPLGSTGGSVGVREIDFVVALDLGTTTGVTNEAFSLGLDYVHNTVTVTINAIIWTLKETLGRSGPTDKHFIVEIDTDGLAKVVFGDNLNGEIPPIGFSVIADFETSNGLTGNVDANTITQILTVISLPGSTTQTANNPQASSGGLDYEGVDRIRVSAPLSIRTLDRAVTFQDYEDIGRLAPGVELAKVDFDCGKFIDVYIAPQGGGIASVPLLTATAGFYDVRRMVTTFINILPAGETELVFVMDITARFRQSGIETQDDVEQALINYGLIDNQNINQAVRVSDIFALVDNLDKVDFVTLTEMYTLPFARPKGHNNILIWTRKTLSNSVVPIKWRLEWTGADFRIFKGSVFQGVIAPLGTFTDAEGTFEFTPVFSVSYAIGDEWEFTVYPWTVDIIIDDFSVPTVSLANLQINVTEQLNPPI